MMSYQIKKGEEDFVHVELQKGGFDQATGKPIGKPYVHITTAREFDVFLENRLGNNILRILHVPDKYELPKPKSIDKEEASKGEKKAYKLAMKDYERLVSLLPKSGGSSDDPRSIRLKELKSKTVPELDVVLESLDLPIEGNKNVKIESILDAEFED